MLNLIFRIFNTICYIKFILIKHCVKNALICTDKKLSSGNEIVSSSLVLVSNSRQPLKISPYKLKNCSLVNTKDTM